MKPGKNALRRCKVSNHFMKNILNPVPAASELEATDFKNYLKTTGIKTFNM